MISFSDSRQGTARFAANIETNGERGFVRGFIYHAVQKAAQGSALPDEKRQELIQKREKLASLVEHLIATGILWSDNGLLAFGPEGEAQYGKQNFMELLSVFTSPPLFKVLNGQKELGFVHESTFYNQKDGPAVLVLAGRSWRETCLWCC